MIHARQQGSRVRLSKGVPLEIAPESPVPILSARAATSESLDYRVVGRIGPAVRATGRAVVRAHKHRRAPALKRARAFA